MSKSLCWTHIEKTYLDASDAGWAILLQSMSTPISVAEQPTTVSALFTVGAGGGQTWLCVLESSL